MLWSLLIGLVVGMIAKFFIPGPDRGGIIVTAVLGMAGAAFAQWAGSAYGAYAHGEPAGFFAAVIGAMVLLSLYRLAIGRNLR